MRTPSPGTPRTRRPSLLRAVALLVVPALALPLAACTGPEIPPAQAAADDLLRGLQTGALDGLDFHRGFTGDPQQQATEVLEPLLAASGAEHPDVTITQVVTETEGDDAGKQATATLQWTWPLAPEAEWTYLTRAELVFVEPEEGSDEPGAWSIAWNPAILVPDLQPEERVTVASVAPARADILDGTGEPLVTNRAVWRLGIDKTHVPESEWEASALALAELVIAGGIAVDAPGYAAKVASAGPKAYVELVTVRQEDPQVDVEAARMTPGVGVIAAELALAPTPTFARPILGRAGEATAEIIEASEGRVKKGDVTGLSGLQKQYDAQLAGSPGITVTVAVPDSDAAPREVFTKEAVNGTPLATTFDVGLQERAESLLADVEPAAAIVAIRPSTGEVLAAASGPGSQGLDTALLGKYAPGSTFKVVDALGFGRHGITPDTTVPCTPTINVNGRDFQNVPEYEAQYLGDIPLRTAIAHSCNTAMISQHDVVSQQDLVTAAQDLGLGVETPVGAPVFYGNVPADATPAQHAATLIGQDRIEASPFTMARIAASVAAGKRVDPVLVRPETPAEPKEVPESALTAAEAETLRSLMGGVVENGSARLLQDVPGIVGAKTGTAQFGDGTQQHTWMIAIAGDLAVAVFVEVGERGSTTSGPIMHAFLTGR
ncbi:penicillin-binding protein transpeptidase [Xylanimonas cellulosilytica DSM 15894]|uniref:Beta-lactamase n=1 Tax=Xylanimonas cellulosilytica (strain DSM 15894 / JCM 12276 / CECT 5975 / KCTC 9989 / LMG 20990 / NBRC 107835 / XIL07) TaxID=446471 RepID=D1BRK9_XYLCX|nr:penicillin-binding transpeptidase domain-containing protein [Xylanimonas cellulosilytica]ACZ32275.1 penicillin-binding protein transpeptidase [Xylanimonas cellulosilytica DSM 15894]